MNATAQKPFKITFKNYRTWWGATDGHAMKLTFDQLRSLSHLFIYVPECTETVNLVKLLWAVYEISCSQTFATHAQTDRHMDTWTTQKYNASCAVLRRHKRVHLSMSIIMHIKVLALLLVFTTSIHQEVRMNSKHTHCRCEDGSAAEAMLLTTYSCD